LLKIIALYIFMIIWHTSCCIIAVTDQIIRNPKIAFVIKTFLKNNYRSGQANLCNGADNSPPLIGHSVYLCIQLSPVGFFRSIFIFFKSNLQAFIWVPSGVML